MILGCIYLFVHGYRYTWKIKAHQSGQIYEFKNANQRSDDQFSRQKALSIRTAIGREHQLAEESYTSSATWVKSI